MVQKLLQFFNKFLDRVKSKPKRMFVSVPWLCEIYLKVSQPVR